MFCPVDTATLHLHEFDQVRLHSCERCRGIWLDVKSLRHLLGDSVPSAGTGLAGAPGQRRCPHCANRMHVRTLHGIHVDICTKCEGIWFDPGELERIVRRSEEPSKIRLSSGSSSGLEWLDVVPDELVCGAIRAIGQIVCETITHAPEVAAEAGSAVLEFVAELLSGL